MFRKTGENYKFKLNKKDTFIDIKCSCGNVVGIKAGKRIISSNLVKGSKNIVKCSICGREVKCL